MLKGKNILIIDTETTGLPETKKQFKFQGIDEFHDYKDNSKYDSSRIIEIAWIYIEDYDDCMDYNEKSFDLVNSYLIKPKNYSKITNAHIHGITFDDAKTKGLLLSKIMNRYGLAYSIQNCDYIIGHNVYFDVSILLNELHRIDFKNAIDKINQLINNDNIVCTMKYGADVMKKKCFKLIDLYEYYYGDSGLPNTEIDHKLLHRAFADVLLVYGIIPLLFFKNVEVKKGFVNILNDNYSIYFTLNLFNIPTTIKNMHNKQ